MNHSARTSAAALAAAAVLGLAACAGEPATTVKESALIKDPIVRTFNTGVAMLEGYNTMTDVRRNSCVEQVKKANCAEAAAKTTHGGVTDFFKLELVNSRKELSSKLGVEANLSARYKVVEVSASVNLEKESQFTSNSLTFLLRGETTWWTHANKEDFTMRLSDAAKKLFDEPTKPAIPQQFFVQCGNSYVDGYQKGAQFYLLLTITTKDQASRDSLEAKLKLKVGLPVIGVEADAGMKMATAMKEHEAQVSLTVRTSGFYFGGQKADNNLLEAALGSKITPEMFEKLIEIHDAMLKSVNSERCLSLGLGYTGAKLEAGEWKCVSDGNTSLASATLVRLNLSDYATVSNLPTFTDTWKPLITFENKLDQARKYVGMLSSLEAAVATTYYDEIAPYQPRSDAERSQYGLAPPQILPSNDPFMKLGDQDATANQWAGRFKPPGGAAFDRVHAAAENCFRGATQAEFGKCTCADKTADLTDKCLAALESYRLTWKELFDYRETARVLPTAAYSPNVHMTHPEGLTFCAKKPGSTMIDYGEARRIALAVANTSFGQANNTVWFQNPGPADAYPRCPVEGSPQFTKPYFYNAPQNVLNAQGRWYCVRPEVTTGVQCVPPGGLFARHIYLDRLSGLPMPPPFVAWGSPGPRAIGVAPGAKITLVFSAALDEGTALAHIKLKDGTTAVPALIAYQAHPLGGSTVVITPDEPLGRGKLYTIEVGTGVKGIDGDALLAAYSSTFTVANAVTSFKPAVGAKGVVLRPTIEAGFAVPVRPITVNATSVKLWQGNKAIAGTVTYDAGTKTAKLVPGADLEPSTTYTVWVSNVIDPGPLGNPVESVWWTFTTGAVGTEFRPEPDETGVRRDVILSASYSSGVSDVPADSFTLKRGTTAVPVTTYVGGLGGAVCKPNASLAANTVYTATVKKTIKDDNGNPVLTEHTWSFTTGAEPAP